MLFKIGSLSVGLLFAINCFSGEIESEIGMIRNKVSCPFAKKSQIWENRSRWDTDLSLSENLSRFVTQDLKPFIDEVKRRAESNEVPLDGIALEAPGDPYGMNIESFSQFVRKVLVSLNKDAVKELANLVPNEDGTYIDNGWQFNFLGKRLFIITFAPFYPENNSRYSYGGKNVILLFQPEESFGHFLSQDKEKRDVQKSNVRSLFAKKGQLYHLGKAIESDSSKKNHEAPRYIKPIHIEDPLIRWWEKVDQKIVEEESAEEETLLELALINLMFLSQ